jgi:LPXTG-site transpeptidase (sortase) family protein
MTFRADFPFPRRSTPRTRWPIWVIGFAAVAVADGACATASTASNSSPAEVSQARFANTNASFGRNAPAAAAAPSTRRPSPTTPSSTTAPPKTAKRAVKAPSAVSPTRLSVPAINVDVPLSHLKLDKAKVLQPPIDPRQAGWWQRNGSTVIVGHVDSKRGAAVFYRVRELKPGDTMTVSATDGSKITYVATKVEQVKKTKFPTDAVYRSGPGQLRLVTCGGAFDRKTGHYEDNIIVYASKR